MYDNCVKKQNLVQDILSETHFLFLKYISGSNVIIALI